MALGIFSRLLGRSRGSASSPVLLFNTLHGKKERFTPITPGHVGMYHCGPTVYDYQHIGNYRPYVFADLLKRLFLSEGFSVKQVINITDVGHLTGDNQGDADSGEDRIEKGAKREHSSAAEITSRYTKDFLETLDGLNIDTEGTIFPKATEHLLEQVAFIRTLEEKGYTYKTSDGVYFDTARFKHYGALGQVNLKGLQEGARVEANPEKKHPTDFALWKFSKPEDNRQQEWDSPWGRGFPGWHIECSAMSTKYLGRRFDIHTGGIDHIPVHHNNEIAQSEAAFGAPFVNYWMHVAHLMIDGKKISKSLGNVVLPSHLKEHNIPLLAYRYWLLTSHYRTQVNFTWEALQAAERAFVKLQRYFLDELPSARGNINEKYRKEFRAALHDDIDTPRCVAVLWNLVKDAHVSDADKKATLLEFDTVLGLELSSAQEFMEANVAKPVSDADMPEAIRKLLKERETARAAKDFTAADEIREKIKTAGFELIDSAEGPRLIRRLH